MGSCSASVCSVTSSRPISTTSRTWIPALPSKVMANITAAQAQQVASLAFLGQLQQHRSVRRTPSSSLRSGGSGYGGAFTTLRLGINSWDASDTALFRIGAGGFLNQVGAWSLHVLSGCPVGPSQAFVFATVAAVPDLRYGLWWLSASQGLFVTAARRKRKDWVTLSAGLNRK